MIRFVLLLVGVPLLAIGGEGLYHAIRNREQRVMTCEQFVRERPKAAWLKLTDCDVDYIGAGYRESNGRISELLFPVRPAGQLRNVPAVAIVATKDGGALGIAQGTIGNGEQPDQEAFLVMMLTIVTSLKTSREVDGYARVGIVEALNARRVVSGLAGPLDPSPVVIDLRAQPQMAVPALEIAAGALAVLMFVYLQIRGRRRARGAATAEQPATPSMAAAPDAVTPVTESPAPMMPQKLRGLMLLNLPRNAGVEAIEVAPPLGNRADVVRKLEETLPDLGIDDSGRGTFNRPDCTISVALGTSEPVATAVLDAQGEGALTCIRALLAATGWRVFAPRRGVFVDAGQLQDLIEPLP
jgi:hypothetical protein